MQKIKRRLEDLDNRLSPEQKKAIGQVMIKVFRTGGFGLEVALFCLMQPWGMLSGDWVEKVGFVIFFLGSGVAWWFVDGKLLRRKRRRS